MDKAMFPLVVLLIVGLLAVAYYIPYGLIWSLNTLFHTGIEPTSEAWWAALFLMLVLGGPGAFGSRRS